MLCLLKSSAQRTTLLDRGLTVELDRGLSWVGLWRLVHVSKTVHCVRQWTSNPKRTGLQTLGGGGAGR